MKLIKVNNPFQRQDREVFIIPCINQSIEDLMIRILDEVNAKHGTFFTLKEAEDIYCVSINGLIIPAAYWDTTKPLENDQIVFMPIVAKGSSEKEILNIIILIAVVIIVGPQGYGLIGTGASVASTIAGMAIIAGTGMLLQAMTPGPQVKGLNFDDFDASQTFSWTPNTTQKQGIIRPRFYGKNKLYGNVIAVHTEISGTDDTKQNIKMLIGLGAGPVQGIVADTIKINDQNINNFTDVSTEEKLGTLNQSIISFFGETKPEYRPNRIVTNTGGPIIYTTPDSDFDDLEIEIIFPRGLYFANDQGSLSDHSISIRIEISVADAGSWSTLVAESISDNTTSPKRKAYSASGTYTGGSPVSITNGVKYDIRVSKTTVDQASSRYGDQLRLGSLREVINDDFIYPGTALLAIEALATDQLSGALNVSCIQEGLIVNVYDGTSWSLEYSNNPAWVLYDIFSQPIISGDGSSGSPYTIERYEGIDPSNLNTSKFFELAQFCAQTGIPDGEGGTEQRIRFNGGFDIGTTPWEAALKVCEIARCMPIWTGSELTLAIDKADDYVQEFNVANIKEGSFKETFMPQSELVSEIEIHYHDEAQDFKRVPFTLLEDNVPNTSRRVTLELFGVTKQSEAWRAGMHRLAQNRYLKSMIDFEVDIDAINSTLGNVIAVQHDVPDWGAGGRVVSATTLSIIVDKDMEYISGSQHEVLVRKADDALNLRTTTSKYNDITGVDSSAKEFQIDGDFTDEYKSGDSIKVVDSGSNDKTYILASDSVFVSNGYTTLIVDEIIPDDTVIDSGTLTDGGLYNLRRVVVSSVFKNASDATEAPVEDDIYTFGIQDLHARQYRILNMSKTSDQYIKITAVEYNPLVYVPDGDNPIIATEQGISSPDGDDSLLIIGNPGYGNVIDIIPGFIRGGPTIDVPLTTNLQWNDDTPDGNSISWTSVDSGGLILFTINGITYEITPDNTNKKYIYWDEAFTTTFQSTNVLSTAIGSGKWLMASNDSGIAYPAFGRKIIHGGIIQADTITADFGQIANLTVGTAQIIDLNVTTLKINNNAVSESATAYTNGLISVSGITIVTIQSVTITVVGNKLAIMANFTATNTIGFRFAQLYRDAVLLFSTKFADNVITIMTTDTPSSGTYTYYLKIQTTTSPSGADAEKRFLHILELKK